MKRSLIFALSLALVALAGCSKKEIYKPEVFAHQGYWKGGETPNSIEALRAAGEKGLAGVTLDVRVTSDSVAVVIEKDSLGGKSIAATPFAAFAEDLAEGGKPLHKLSDYLSAAETWPTMKLFLNILAPDGDGEVMAAETVAAAVKNTAAAAQTELASSSFYLLQQIQRVWPEANVWYISRGVSPLAFVEEGFNGAVYWLQFLYKSPMWLKESADKGLRSGVLIVNNEQDIRNMRDMKAERIITDDPDLVAQVLKEKKK